MKMNQSSTFAIRHAMGRRVLLAAASTCLLGGALAWLSPARAAQTDISSTPITNSTAAQAKPNIMLLMDTSGSMGWSHMPDEVESVTGIGSIGYKSSQCNALYYNPNTVYGLPRKADGTFFPTPSFTAAYYNVYKDLYTTPAASPTLVNLSTSFKAYDDETLRLNLLGDPYSPFNDTPQPAYYYVYTGTQTLSYASAPCTDPDVGATVGATGGGTWTRVVVGASERQNFANWYTYYRTRMALTKSAISLAFTPLTDSFRVGFITVYPKTSPSAASIDTSKYLAISDFNTTQRGLWFDKVFSQVPDGSSPAREGLARVGRHYAGKTDGINTGMTGDPVQYSCQQNFTIMTTDGYWNDQQESTSLSGGFKGGPVKIDGVNFVARYGSGSDPGENPDGSLTDSNSPRPIWDGFSDTTQTVRNRTRTYAYASCVSSYFNVATLQNLVSTTQVTAATTQLQQSTLQNLQSTSQNLRTQVQNLQTTSGVTQSTTQVLQTIDIPLQSTTQNLRSTTQNLQSTTQNLQRTSQILQSTTQNLRSTTQNLQSTTQTLQSTSQILRSTTQNLRSTTQNLQSTTQTRQSTSQILRSTTQNLQSTAQNLRSTTQTLQSTSQILRSTTQNLQSTTQNLRSTSQTLQSTSQNLQSTTQNLRSTTQNLQSTSQVRKSTQQILSCDASTELCTPTLSCTAGGLISCQTVSTGPTLVASCTPASPTSGNAYTTTTCATTNLTTNVAVASCTPVAASSGNSYTSTTCSTNNTTNVPVSSCTPSSASSGNSYTTTTCSTNNTSNVPVASCTPVSASSGNSWTTTTCSTNNTSNVPVASCTPSSASSGNSYTATTCSTSTTTNVPVASCTPSSASSGNSYTTTTCSTNNTSNVPVASCTAASASSGNSYTTTTCSTNNTSNVPVASCTPSSATSGNSYTTTTCTTNNSTAVGVSSCTPVAASSGNSYTATVCTPNNTTNVPVSSCTPSSASSGNSYTTTTCSTNNTSNVPVASCTAASPSSGNGYTTTTCSTNNTSNVPVASCTAASANSGNSWTTTTCVTNNSTAVAVSSCTPVAASSGNSYTATVCTPNNTTNVAVSSCTPSSASSGNSWTTTTCSTNNTSNVPVSSCTPSSASSGNSWTTTTCSTNNTTNVPVATCTAASASSGNSWTTTTCVTNNSTAVAVASCTAVAASSGNSYTATVCTYNNTTNVAVSSCTPSSASSGNSWTTTTCSTNNTTNVPVSSCTPSSPTSGNGYTTTTCPAPSVVSGPTGVASCTPVAASSGNGYQRTTCTSNNTTNVPVASCTAASASSGNSYTTTTCTPVGSANVPVASCTPSGPTSGNGYITTTCPAPYVSADIPVASCTPSSANSGNGYVTTTCSTNNTTNVPVASCTPSSATSGNSYTTTTCPAPATTGPTPVASCTPVAASSGNNWTATTCSTATTPATGVASCTDTAAGAGNSWTATTCNTVTTGPTAAATCTPAAASAGNSWTATTCSTNTTGPTISASCTPAAASSGNSWTATTCTPVTGQKIQYTTTTTTTATPYSGSVVSGSPTVTTVSDDPVDKDGVCYVTGAGPALEALPSPNPQTAPGDGSCAAWPCTSTAANSGGSRNSLADVAQYYYVTDLRPSMTDDVPAIGAGPEDDRLHTQHMTTFSIALGVSGTLNYRSDYKAAGTGDFADIRTGGKSWPLWPDPSLSSWDSTNLTYTNKTTWNNARSIDDFWHAAVNGRGQFFSARNPDDVVSGIAGALAGIQSRLGGAAAGTSTLAPVTGNNMAFTANYTTSQWTGDVEARTIDLSTGVFGTAVTWSASTLLDTRVGAACDTRTIHLMRQGATNNLTPFTWNTQTCDSLGLPTGTASTGLSSAEQAYFNAGEVAQLSQYPSMTDGTSPTVDQRTPAAGANLVNFLRGQRGFEGFITNDASKLYRTRTHILGDIVGGQPIYVKAPFARYQDSGYLTFKTNNADRTPMIYVPANDGMLHAFYAETNTSTGTEGGKEAWAVIPSSVLPNLYKLADNNYGNLHQYSVDGVPAIGDAYDPSGSGTWKTLLVGGLNAGGRGYYALDITDPASPKGLWEFNWSATCYDSTQPTTYGADCHIGYTFGKPIITKLANGTWVVLVTSGHNNINTPNQAGDGQGYLYVLNAFTGKIMYKISTGEGDASTPSGLVHLNNFVDNAAINNTTLRVYGGDLLGNIWRFDINDTIAPSGREATLLGVAKDSNGNRQPITTRPELAELDHSPMVFVATGKLLGATDLTDTHTQSIYGFVDPLTSASPAYADLRGALKPRVLTQVGTVPNATRTVNCPMSSTPTAAEQAACSATAGWVLDLPDPGERVNVDMKLYQGTMVVGSNVPQSTACTSGGYSWLTNLNFSSGLAVVTTATGASGSSGAGSSTSGAGMTASQYVSNSLIVGLSVIRLPSGQAKTVLSTSGGGAGTTTTALTGGGTSGSGGSGMACVGGGGGTASCDTKSTADAPVGKRVSWREIVQ